MVGYMHPEYAESLAEFGTPRELPRCGGWILERQIPEFPYRDAMGCYPLFCCQDWSQLNADLEDISDELVSLSLVTDPFGAYDLTYLKQCFRDLVILFKEYYIVDLVKSKNADVSNHHRYYARRALKKVYVEECQEPLQFLDEWIGLYEILIKKHNIQGIKAFSRKSFARLLRIPGIFMLRAVYENTTIGAQIYLLQEDAVHRHLSASSEVGYKIRSSYALDWYSIKYFSDKARWLILGGSAGLEQDYTDGLNAYKRGWSTITRPVYFCGRIFNHERYEEIVKVKNIVATDYFPVYRKGEFG